jgi:hypothetical protein
MSGGSIAADHPVLDSGPANGTVRLTMIMIYFTKVTQDVVVTRAATVSIFVFELAMLIMIMVNLTVPGTRHLFCLPVGMRHHPLLRHTTTLG